MTRQVGEPGLWNLTLERKIILHVYEELIPLPIFWRTYIHQRSCSQMFSSLWDYFALNSLSSSFYRYLCKYFGLVSLINSAIGLRTALSHCIFTVLSNPLTDVIMMFPQNLLISCVSALSLTPWQVHRKKTSSFLWFSICFDLSPSRFIFGAQMLTGLWWVLWQTLQPCFPQRGSASGIPACPGSPSQCTQWLSLKIGSVSYVIQ